MAFKDLKLNINSKEITECQSDSNVFSMKNTLTVLRGQSFFTSALTVKNKQGHWLLGLDYHYERFQRSYKTMFERSQFPISYEEFKHFVSKAIEINKQVEATYWHCIIFCIAGKPESLIDKTGRYNNGFGGELTEMVITFSLTAAKPFWTYQSGIHCVTYPHQRPIAMAKPNNYLGGIVSQHRLDTLNTLTLLYQQYSQESFSFSRQKAYELYETASFYDKKALRICLNDRRGQAVTGTEIKQQLLQYGMAEKTMKQIQWIQELTLININELEQTNPHELFHESIFTSPDTGEFLLEGVTFSLMGINRQDQLVFIPLQGNTTQKKDDLNTGYILQSTSIACLQSIAVQYNIDHVIKPISVDKISDLKAIYAISTTRFNIRPTIIECNPIQSMNNQFISTQPSTVYLKLMTSFKDYLERYTYQTKKSNGVQQKRVTIS